MISYPLVRYVLMSALRDRLILSLVLMVMTGTALAVFLGAPALIEGGQFSVVFAAGGLRFAGVAGLVLFVVTHMRRSFESRDIDFLLARPLSRTGFILSHALAFTFIAVLIGGAITLAVMAASLGNIGDGTGLWAVSFMVELIIMAQAALFFSMVVTSTAGGTMAVFGLYILARLMGQLLGIASAGAMMHGFAVLQNGMYVISMVVPRLDLMAQTSWLVYPDAAGGIGYGFIVLQGLVYSALLIVATMIDLRRRQF